MKKNITTKTFAYLLLKGYQLAFKNKVDYLLNKLVHIVELILITNLLSAFYNNETSHKRSYGTHNFLKLTSNTTLNKALLLLTLLGLGVGEVMGQTTSTKSGDWNDPTVWNTGFVPTSTGAVIITSNHIVTVTDDRTCASITFNGSAGTLTVNSGATLSVSGSITVNRSLSNNVTTTITGAGSISCSNLYIGQNASSNLTANRFTQLVSTISSFYVSGNLFMYIRFYSPYTNTTYFDLNDGVFTLDGTITPGYNNYPSDGSTAYFVRMTQGNASGRLVLNNEAPWGNNSTTINCPWNNKSNGVAYSINLAGANATVVYNRSDDQTINRSGNSSCASSTITINYTNLTLAGSGVKTLPDRSAAQVSGTLSMQGTATLTTTGTLTYGTSSTLEYKGSATQTTAQGEFLTGAGAPLNLIIDNPNGVTLHAARTLRTSGANTLTLVNGTLNNSTQNLTLSNASNVIRSGGSLSAAPIFGTSVNITYNQHSGSITTGPELPTAPTVLNNITVNNTNGVNLNANTTVNGNLTVNNSGVLNLGSITLNRATSGGMLTLGDNTTLRIGGIGFFPTNYSAHSIAATSTVNYNGANQEAALLNSSQSYGNLTLSGSGTKTFANATDTNVRGNFTIEGVTVTAPTKLNFNGTTAQSIAGLAYNNIAFSNAGTKTFTSNASVSPTSAITFSGTPGTVDFDGTSNNLEFVLQSTVNGTARVGNSTDWTLNGRVRAERYIPAKRAWRLLTAPLKGNANNSIYANWQGTTNEGLLLWHPQGGGDTGLVVGPQSNVWSYNNSWIAVTNTNTTSLFNNEKNNAFIVFATGPSNSTNIASGQAETTLKPKGELITGSTQYNTLTTNQYHLIGNPYASPLNTVSLKTSNPNFTFWLLDPSLGNIGGYYTYDGNNWTPTPPNGSSGQPDNTYIQSGQGFFVRSSSATSFTISESHKVAGNSNTWFNRNATDTTADKIRLLLYKQINNEWQLTDGILAVNSAIGNNDLDATDTEKMSNFNENMGFRYGTSTLAIEYRGLPTLTTIQPMRLTGTTVQPYQIRVKTENYSNSTLQPYLEDTQSGTLTEIPIDGSEVIVSFTGVASTASNPDTRFRIVYSTELNNEEFTSTWVSLYPNPVCEGLLNINLKSNEGSANFVLNNLLGQVVHEGVLDSIQNTLKLPNLEEGFYLISVKQNNNKITSKIYIK